MNAPLAGSLQPIHGTVTGLDNPAHYKFCVYLRSDIDTYSGE